MTLEEQCILACYHDIGDLNADHGVYLVQQNKTKKVYVKKNLTVYDIGVYRYLQQNPVPNTPHIYELAEDHGTLIVIEEYLSGSTLEELAEQHGPFSEEAVIDIMSQLCVILQRLHSAQPPIIHRDIKPGNIMLSPDGVVKLLDMNAAKRVNEDAERDTRLIGTVGYAAPEQFGFGASGVQTDIYAAGVLINYLLTGELPQTRMADGTLRPVIERCTRMEPEGRYQTAAELCAALTGSEGRKDPSGNRRRFLPPGFRSGRLWKMLLALIGYAAWLAFSIAYGKDTGGIRGMAAGILVFLMLFLPLLFTADYLGVQSRFPLSDSASLPVRVLGIVLWDAVLVCAVLVLLAMTV